MIGSFHSRVTLPFKCDPGMTAPEMVLGTVGSVDEAGPDLTGFPAPLLYRSHVLLSVPGITPDPAWATLLLPTFLYQVLLHSIY